MSILILILHELGGGPQDMLILVLMMGKVLMLVLVLHGDVDLVSP